MIYVHSETDFSVEEMPHYKIDWPIQFFQQIRFIELPKFLKGEQNSTVLKNGFKEFISNEDKPNSFVMLSK